MTSCGPATARTCMAKSSCGRRSVRCTARYRAPCARVMTATTTIASTSPAARRQPPASTVRRAPGRSRRAGTPRSSTGSSRARRAGSEHERHAESHRQHAQDGTAPAAGEQQRDAGRDEDDPVPHPIRMPRQQGAPGARARPLCPLAEHPWIEPIGGEEADQEKVLLLHRVAEGHPYGAGNVGHEPERHPAGRSARTPAGGARAGRGPRRSPAAPPRRP